MVFLSILILLVAVALPSIKQSLSSHMILRTSSLIFIFSAIIAFNSCYIQSIGSGIGILSGLFQITLLSQFFDVFLFTVAGCILAGWPIINSIYKNQVLNEYRPQVKNININLPAAGGPGNILNYIGLYTPKTEYCILILFSALGSSLLVSCSDLISFYLSIELQSFGLYVLATVFRDYETATAAGLKYFLLGALSSCFILLGCGLMYSFTGLTNFEGIYTLISIYSTNTCSPEAYLDITSGVGIGLIFVFSGLLFKIAAAPFHSWSVDVYDDTPTIVTTWLTIIPKISILVLLLELYSGFGFFSSNLFTDTILLTYDISNVIKMLLLVSSLLSLLVGTIVGLSQTRIKKLLAYSTISHIGFILLALAVNSEQGIESFLFYIIQYSLTNLNIFLIILALGYFINFKGVKLYLNSNKLYLFDYDIRYIQSFKRQFFSNPILALALIVSLFSMAGIPPLLGFFSKQFVLNAALESGYNFMSIIAILVSVISASYYLRIIILLFTDNQNAVLQSNNLNGVLQSTVDMKEDKSVGFILSNFHSILISVLTLSILLFIFKPSLLLNSTQLLALSLFNT